MSGGAAFVSSRAQEVANDDSDRVEDQDDVPSFVCEVTPGDEVASLLFDDTHNNCDTEGDATLIAAASWSANTVHGGRHHRDRSTVERTLYALQGQGTSAGARRGAITKRIRRCLSLRIQWLSLDRKRDGGLPALLHAPDICAHH
jgi:hypothetical protein